METAQNAQRGRGRRRPCRKPFPSFPGGMLAEIHINVRFQAKPGKQAELSRRMVELRPDVEALGGTSIVTVDSDDETVLYFIETFPDQAALDADMKTPLVQALIADLGELTIHGTDFRTERSSPVAA